MLRSIYCIHFTTLTIVSRGKSKMKDNMNNFKDFIYDFISLLEELTEKEPKIEDGRYFKYLAQLRITEHSFNFLLDQFMYECLKTGDLNNVISSNDFHKIKERRNVVASKLAGKIKSDTQKQKVLKDLLQNYILRVKNTDLKGLFVKALVEEKNQNST